MRWCWWLATHDGRALSRRRERGRLAVPERLSARTSAPLAAQLFVSRHFYYAPDDGAASFFRRRHRTLLLTHSKLLTLLRARFVLGCIGAGSKGKIDLFPETGAFRETV